VDCPVRITQFARSTYKRKKEAKNENETGEKKTQETSKKERQKKMQTDNENERR
jgi:hypothetical protein